MIALKDIQTTVAAAIAAHSYLSAAPNVSAVVYDGSNESTVESYLRTRGAVVSVLPVTRGVKKDGAAGKVLLFAEVMVRVSIAPMVNSGAGAANRNIYEMVRAVTEAVLGIAPTAGGKKFETAEEFIQLSPIEEGLLSYDLFFNVLTVLH